ncbi:HD domain-containing protein [Salibacterium aidingense]|uniref:HD domain-containing protein n=1 Tax=Salibacterium aidingense TaxID=384933 RepID=UPI00041B2110|nr:HD domain-containing protein [Salibacterium aidingense]
MRLENEMNKEWIIEQAKEKAEAFFRTGDPAHDYWHAHRVAVWAVKLAGEEGADAFVCELASWLHDIADAKLNESEETGLFHVEEWLREYVKDEKTEQKVMGIIAAMSFRHGDSNEMTSLEGRVVQDADRLDAVGAIGIARTFAYAGKIGETLHRPDLPGGEKRETALEHFYNKLLRLKSLMNTKTASEIANTRQKFMISYLEQFYSEWEGKR